MEKDRFIPQWVEDKRFSVECAIAVVKRSNHYRPRYSYEIAFVGKEKPSRFCFIRTSGEGTGRVEIDMSSSDATQKVTTIALEYIRDMYQRQEDEIIQRKTEKEQASLNRDRPTSKPGLKELSKRDKLAHHVMKDVVKGVQS